MKNFEYQIVQSKDLEKENSTEIDEYRLNLFGEQGWELVVVVNNEYIFKRDKQNQIDEEKIVGNNIFGFHGQELTSICLKCGVDLRNCICNKK